MKFSEGWLRTMCNPPLTSLALRDVLTMSGLEVEEATLAAPPFASVVVGRIDQVKPHPDAERLLICMVDVGGPDRLQVVCGAPNVVAGMLAPCALEGAILPGGVTVERTVIRGVESRGMLCSASELGVDLDASGLLALESSLIPGTSVRDALALDDTLLTLKITPNRADCLSIAGLARDVSASTGTSFALPIDAPATVTFEGVRPVRVEDTAACPRFVARLIDGIDPRAHTPIWMRRRLERSGLRSISAVVDITNYVMLELGQPLHAYDDRLLDGTVVVRFAREGEQLTLLNGQVLNLEADLLLVADERKPLGLAGIMGGEHSGIDGSTKRVFLEGAFWHPAVIQGKMRRLGFSSDAGYRFERGVDFDGCARGVERATQLILEICGGNAGPLTDALSVPDLPRRDPVRLRVARVAKVLGVAIPEQVIATALTLLGLPFVRDSSDFVVTPPPHRFDIAIEEDLIEEVARIHGYDAIPSTPAAHVQQILPSPESRRSTHALKRMLVDRDWQEVVTFGFVSSSIEKDLDAGAVPVKVLNPIASHLDVMRTSLLPGLIETLRTNLSRKAPRVRIFELGRAFRRAPPGYEQPLRLAGLAYGQAVAEQWGVPGREIDFFDVKADLEALAVPRSLSTRAFQHAALHPGRAGELMLDGAPVGWLGELHPRLLRAFDLPKAPIVFEIDAHVLLEVSVPTGRPVSRLPVVRRDLAIVVDESVPVQALLDALALAKPSHVISLGLFDVYRGPGLTDGRKSLAILVLMQDTSRNLTDADIDATEALLLSVARDRFGASLRT